ncbi:MAG: DUF2865 domain-containing protein [Hyphomicrobiaceae bacterium]|nr:DUF2865 domain-containing protein [Hyphomicrobiaceae bacterium]
MARNAAKSLRVAFRRHLKSIAGLGRFAAAALVALMAGAAAFGAHSTAAAQGFSWPWESSPKPVPRDPPIPREPIRRDPARPGPAPGVSGGWDSDRSSICLRLEQRLVQETQRGSQVQNVLPRIESDLRQSEQNLRRLQSKLDKADCYEWFLFSKQLRNSRECRGLVDEVDQAKRQHADLEVQRQEAMGTGGRSVQDEIVRELARNNCGQSYQQEARRRDTGPLSGYWQDEDSGGGGMGSRYSSVPFATYRTVCVRLCDGYYFPVSFSTLPNHFQRDAEVCASKCAAPAQLYYYQNPGGAVDQMQAFDTNEKYTKLRTAFLYRKEYVAGCSCKQAEYIPQTPAPGGVLKQGAASGEPARGPQIGEAFDPWRPR